MSHKLCECDELHVGGDELRVPFDAKPKFRIMLDGISATLAVQNRHVFIMYKIA